MNLGFTPSLNGAVQFSAIPVGGSFIYSSNLFTKRNNNVTSNSVKISETSPTYGDFSASDMVYPINVVVDQVLS